MALKIAFDANPLVSHKSGVGYYTHGLVQALADAMPQDVELIGYYFNFLGRKKPVDLPEASNIKYVQSKIIPGKLLNICRRLGFQLPLEVFTRQRADIALFTNFVSLPTIHKTLQVITVYDLCFIDCPQYVADKNRTFLQRWVPKSLHKASLIVTISEFTKRRILDIYGTSDTSIHITPIPPAPQTKPDLSIIEKYGLASGYLLFMGTLEPRKNIIGLLYAYSLLPKTMKNKVPLVLAGGKGWHDAEILTKLDKLKADGLSVINTGYISDAERAALYINALLCVQPSHYEGFGMPILEAMQYGKPVACSDIEVLREVAGDAAVYFDQNNPQSIADTISSLINNPDKLNSYGRLGLKRVAKFPTWDKVAKDFYARLTELTNRNI